MEALKEEVKQSVPVVKTRKRRGQIKRRKFTLSFKVAAAEAVIAGHKTIYQFVDPKGGQPIHESNVLDWYHRYLAGKLKPKAKGHIRPIQIEPQVLSSVQVKMEKSFDPTESLKLTLGEYVSRYTDAMKENERLKAQIQQQKLPLTAKAKSYQALA